MLTKIKKWWQKIKQRYAYDMCYNDHEGYGAVFGMCNCCDDKNCPYYTNVNNAAFNFDSCD